MIKHRFFFVFFFKIDIGPILSKGTRQKVLAFVFCILTNFFSWTVWYFFRSLLGAFSPLTCLFIMSKLTIFVFSKCSWNFSKTLHIFSECTTSFGGPFHTRGGLMECSQAYNCLNKPFNIFFFHLQNINQSF